MKLKPLLKYEEQSPLQIYSLNLSPKNYFISETCTLEVTGGCIHLALHSSSIPDTFKSFCSGNTPQT